MGSVIRIATAVLVCDGRVLMVHRHPMREAYPDRWALPGGHIEPGELPRDAVSRECREEIGVQIHNPRPIHMAVADPKLDATAFLVTRWTGDLVNAAPEEHDDLRWFSPSELRELDLAHPETLPNILSAILRPETGPTKYDQDQVLSSGCGSCSGQLRDDHLRSGLLNVNASRM